MQAMTRDTLRMVRASEDILCFERKIFSDTIFVWLHFGDKKVSVANDTGHALSRLFDSASTEWDGPGSAPPDEIDPGDLIEIHPHCALVFEKKFN
jgi:hypothetical protein